MVRRKGKRITGVNLRRLSIHRDDRGSFTEVFRTSWDLGTSPIQWSVVKSERRVLRGMYLHRRHDEYFCIIDGRASVGLHDLRKGSATEGAWSLIDLDGRAMTCLVFPRGVLHGWYFHEPSIHVQGVSEAYDDYKDDDNLGCHWADPKLEIPWPDRDPVLSKRSASLPALDELLEQLRV